MSGIEITGLAEVAAMLPEDRIWHEMRIRFRRAPNNTAEVVVSGKIYPLYNVYEKDGELWERVPATNELRLLDGY